MRYLISYKIFESNLSQYFEKDVVEKSKLMIEDLKDILLELEDIGYMCNVNFAPFLRKYLAYDSPTILISITKPDYPVPLWKNEKEKMKFDEVILRVIRYVKMEDHKYEYDRAILPVGIVKYMLYIYKE